MTFTAREIVAALHNEGWLDAAFVNTGGWVMNVSFTPICQHGVTLGEILASDNGDWGYGDIDEPADGVTVMAYGADGNPLDDRMWTVEDVRGAVLAFDDLSYALERYCDKCSRGSCYCEPCGGQWSRDIAADDFDLANNRSL